MSSNKKLLLMYCEENLHVGSGSATGTIDLPIQRESHTGFPKIESSSLRGAIREAIRDSIDNDKENIFESVFGKWDSGDQHSAIDFPDAKLLFFPVRSYLGVFAWITCPLVLNRFSKDIENWINIKIPLEVCDIKNNEIIVQNNSILESNNEVVLEEFLFTKISGTENSDPTSDELFPKINDKQLGEWMATALNNAHNIICGLKDQIAIVSDDVFKDFVNLYTVKITRNRIDPETGTATGMALFNEEFIPSESIFYSFALASDEFKNDGLKALQVIKFITQNFRTVFRLGGDKGIGKGLVRQYLLDVKS